MIYKIKLSPKVQRQLRKLDTHTAAIILRYLSKHVDGKENPRLVGKSLSANRAGQWRYRIGDYRIICEIIDSELVVLALTVGHRKEVYD